MASANIGAVTGQYHSASGKSFACVIRLGAAAYFRRSHISARAYEDDMALVTRRMRRPGVLLRADSRYALISQRHAQRGLPEIADKLR